MPELIINRASLKNTRLKGVDFDYCSEKEHAGEPILARKPRCPTGNARIREHLRVARVRDLGFLAEGKPSARSELPILGPIRGIPRFSCQNPVFAAYFLREEARYLSNVRQNRETCGKSKGELPQLIPADQSRHPDPRRRPQSRRHPPPNRIVRLDAIAEIARYEDTSSGHYPALSPYRPIRFRSSRLLIGNSFGQNA